MPHLNKPCRTQISCWLVPVFLLLALVTACTRKPFDPSPSETRNENRFTFSPVLESATIWQVAAASAPDGHIAVAAATDYRELILLESSAGAWSTIATLSGEGLHPSSISLAPGPGGAWWILASNSEVGMKLYRVGGAGDSSLVIPKFNNVAWDSTSYGALASDSQGRPVTILRAGSVGLVRAALADTGWTLSQVPQTGVYSTVDDFTIDALGREHLVFHRTSENYGQYRRADADTTISMEITNSGVNLALAVSSGGFPFVAGSVGYQDNLLVWQLLDSDEVGLFWVSETLPIFEDLYVGNFDICLTSEGKPYIAFAAWQGAARFTVNMATREAGTDHTWELVDVVKDLARVGATNRMKVFRVVIDVLDRPHFFYLSGDSGSMNSSLWVAVPIS